MSYPITDIDGIDGEVAAVLKSAGIRSTDRLLEAARTVKGRKVLATKTGFNEKQLLYWANVADRMRIKGVRKEYAELLQAAGVDTVKELKYRNPINLAKAMADANRKRRLVRLLPSEKMVKRWIENAKLLPLKITYGRVQARLTAPRRPRKATGMGMARTLEISTGSPQKPAQNVLAERMAAARPLVMGILTVTPDSCSDGGRFFEPSKAIAHAHEMAAQGADIIDIGAESTRPYGGPVPVSADDEKSRLATVLPAVVAIGAPVSIDTIKASIAAWALDKGATIVNDVWG